MRQRKAQATEQIATVELEKLLDISAKAGNAQPIAQPVDRDDVEIIREPKKFAESSGVGKPALAVPVPVYEEEDDLAIPVEVGAPVAEARTAEPPAPAFEVAPTTVAPPRTTPAPAPSRRLWWLTLLVALVASGAIAARMLGL